MSGEAKDRRHGRIALACAGFVAVMVGAAFAAVPLYSIFCSVTGFDGTPSIAKVEALPGIKVGERKVKIRFDANVANDLPWTFTPEQREQTVHVGELTEAKYRITNTTGKATLGAAVYNVTPFQGGGYFTKVDCFCFDQQPLGPNETREVTVLYYVDPAFADDRDAKGVNVITLSYTFFSVEAGS
ncbi:cytochrome c oxidase assembly protein [Acuticoccus mangrovi]|uniref:Cytochrome c oxidase assembly protein CtaG n=1 Tax=Acuticoccus mangrovi TaxID=2796142 RepID=A0A934MMX8_9HYPH|nr:cytochrome c oxidase assembly protein [Acuticoccus mangrovi]MBJ3777674.1 cytochrome c oxidase assembly protein [Acuticoccus mangrovi]